MPGTRFLGCPNAKRGCKLAVCVRTVMMSRLYTVYLGVVAGWVLRGGKPVDEREGFSGGRMPSSPVAVRGVCRRLLSRRHRVEEMRWNEEAR